jgi:hypothetical protein
MGIVKGGGADRDRATDPILELNQCVHARTFVTGGGFHLPVSASDLGHRRPLFWEIILYCHPFTPNENCPRTHHRRCCGAGTRSEIVDSGSWPLS